MSFSDLQTQTYFTVTSNKKKKVLLLIVENLQNTETDTGRKL